MKTASNIFLIKFAAVIVVSFVIITLAPVNENVIVPFTEHLASWSGHVLRLLGQNVAVAGTTIYSSGFAVDIRNGCNGVEAILILVSAILAFPSSLQSRLLGILVGSVVLEMLNVIRIVSLYLLGFYNRELFDLFHSAVWQVLIILASVGIFVVWSARFARRVVRDAHS